MGKKSRRRGDRDWPEAKKLCRLNQNDIEMAKRLGFRPEACIHAIPSPKQKWKLPVKYWIRDLYICKFGEVLGDPPPVPREPVPLKPDFDEDAVRACGQLLYWEYDQNPTSNEPRQPGKGLSTGFVTTPYDSDDGDGVTDDDVPF